ncbi:hypothetical protein V6Z12_D05G145800 [Gossypium hirsutum]
MNFGKLGLKTIKCIIFFVCARDTRQHHQLLQHFFVETSSKHVLNQHRSNFLKQ